jgi:hypothetical protein
VEKALDDPKGCKEIDKAVNKMMETDLSKRWTFGNAMFTFHAGSPSEWMRMTRPYTMKDVASKITCKMLVVDSEGDRYLPGQAKKLYNALQYPKDFMLFTKEEGAEEHCQFGAMRISNERILNWLDDAMNMPRQKYGNP